MTSISAIDGRYRAKVHHLDDYFSEYALIKYRVKVEVEYFLFLGEQKFFTVPAALKKHLQKAAEDFSLSDAKKVKAFEKTTNHDVKAVEYFLKEKLDGAGHSNLKEWIHFGLTSQDVNNTAIPLLWKHALEFEYVPALLNLNREIGLLAKKWRDIPLLARTHGQPASPTKLGKELMVFVDRIENQVELLLKTPISAKFGGATGNFNAHHIAYPSKNWIAFADKFVENKLQLKRQQFTTQIEHYDNLAAHFDALKRINAILVDFCRDIWTYISMEYFKQQTVKGEIG